MSLKKSNKKEIDLRRAIQKKFPENFLNIEYGLGGQVGIPDMLYVHPDHPVCFIELKRNNKSPIQVSQRVMFKRLDAANKKVFMVCWDDKYKDILFKDISSREQFPIKLSDLTETINSYLSEEK